MKDFDDLLGCKNTDRSEFVKAGEMLTAKVNSIPGCATNNNGKIVFKKKKKRTSAGTMIKSLVCVLGPTKPAAVLEFLIGRRRSRQSTNTTWRGNIAKTLNTYQFVRRRRGIIS